MIHKIFVGRYRLEEKAGVGGMAEVYKAFDTTLGRTVAVKVLHRQYASDQDFIARFKREAQAAANLNQRNIVNVYDWGAENGTYFLVMEYLVGQNLKEIIEENGPLSANRAMEIGLQVAAALQTAHKHEIVHRDIKPQNIVMTEEGEVKVTDFGIARSTAGNVTQTASIMGTAHYLSPEQAKSDNVGAASDIYSLGVVLYEMVTGRVPFEGESPVAVALKHIQDTPTPPSEIVATVPPELEALIKKAMAKNPADRYKSAAELRDDLIRLSAGMPAQNTAVNENDQTMVFSKPPTGNNANGDQKRGRRGLKIVSIAVLLIALFIGSAFATSTFLGQVSKSVVPEIVGLTADEAKKLLAENELKLRTGEELYDDKTAAGVILSQSPAPGKELARGKVVTVTVSRGRELVTIPDLRNKILNQATFTLSKLGLNVGSIRRDFSDTVAEDYVIVQEPPAERNVSVGTFVNLVISEGPQPQKTPSVTGKAEQEAKTIIANEGLTAAVQETFDDAVAAGKVIEQSPVAGVPIKRDETVTITISKGPELVTVPNLIGEAEATAQETVATAQLTIKVKTSVADADSYGKVVAQAPEAAAKARKGSLVTIWVGKKPADEANVDSN